MKTPNEVVEEAKKLVEAEFARANCNIVGERHASLAFGLTAATANLVQAREETATEIARLREALDAAGATIRVGGVLECATCGYSLARCDAGHPDADDPSSDFFCGGRIARQTRALTPPALPPAKCPKCSHPSHGAAQCKVVVQSPDFACGCWVALPPESGRQPVDWMSKSGVTDEMALELNAANLTTIESRAVLAIIEAWGEEDANPAQSVDEARADLHRAIRKYLANPSPAALREGVLAVVEAGLGAPKSESVPQTSEPVRCADWCGTRTADRSWPYGLPWTVGDLCFCSLGCRAEHLRELSPFPDEQELADRDGGDR